MKRYDLIVIGAGPAGLSASIEAAKAGMKVIVFDENEKPGGQLFKQIHKFFGSKEHKAKIRGFRIGDELLESAAAVGVTVCLNSTVIGIYQDKEVTVKQEEAILHYKGDAIIVATGATENMVTFPGWTLPGVIGAGAAQTMMNLHYVKPGQKILMLGSGNVGLVVSYQLLQSGCEVVALTDAAPRVGGYGVHAAKVARYGVPFYLNHTIIKAHGEEAVTGVTIGEVDAEWNVIPGTEKYFEVDTICLAVGLSPMSQILHGTGCEMKDTPGGYVPVCNQRGETSISGLFVAGDVSGIEEASSAMIEGRIAGIGAAAYLGYLKEADVNLQINQMEDALESLRQGMFAPENRGKRVELTEEGLPVSEHLLKYGYIGEDEISRFPGVTSQKGVHPVIECTQNIPCNPCQDACSQNCIRIGERITSLPVVDADHTCTGCGMCVATCSGQAIFLVQEDYETGYAKVTIPYEFCPLPAKGDLGIACDRSGKELCSTEVLEVRNARAFDKTCLVSLKVPNHLAMSARAYKSQEVKVG